MSNKINSKMVRFFSALSDETRLKILLILVDGSKNVGQIHNSLGKEKITLSAVSHQLKSLTDKEIIVSKKSGREKFFSLSGDFCWCILRDAMKHFDNKKLNKMVSEIKEREGKVYQCKACKLIYKNKVWAKKCERWCKKTNSCNLEIIKHAVKRREK